MANFLEDCPDLQYYLNQGIDWETLASLTEVGYRAPDGFKSADEALAFYREVAAMVGAFAADDIAPHAAEIDRQGVRFAAGEVSFPPRLQAIFGKMRELGLFGLTLPRELGGTNAPMLLNFVAGEMLARADLSVMVHHGFHGGIATAMLVLSMLEGSTELDQQTARIVKTRWGREIAEIAAGDAWGSMDITEPDAGSDMAALRTAAHQDADGTWRLTGQKIFITSGHGKHHFVIARTERDQPGSVAGLKGLSLFLVRAYDDDPVSGARTRMATLDRVEEKLGHHGSATVAVTFDGTPAQLVGKRGQGFSQMLELMNHARLGVGFECIGLCESALRMARGYAGERQSMGKAVARHELVADMLDEMEVDIVGLRALAMHAAFHEEVGHKLVLYGRFPGAAPDGAGEIELAARARQHRAVARRATPLLKYLGAEKAVEMARRCLQIHGGNGYMREYGAEKLLRDALVLPIYEGTSQIQALMATKDTLTGILRAPAQFLKRLAQTRWRSLAPGDGVARRVAQLQVLSLTAQQHLVKRTLATKFKAARPGRMTTWPKKVFKDWNPREDFGYALLHAERLTRLLADQEIVEALAAQARRHPERRELLIRYLDRAEPRARLLHHEITTTGERLLARLAASENAAGSGGDGAEGEGRAVA